MKPIQPIQDGTKVFCIINETTNPRIMEAEVTQFATRRSEHGSDEFYTVRESDELGIRYQLLPRYVFESRPEAQAELAKTITARIESLEYQIKEFKAELKELEVSA